MKVKKRKDYESRNAYERAKSSLEFAKRAIAMNDEENDELIYLVHTLYDDVSVITSRLLDVVNDNYVCCMDFYKTENHLCCMCNKMIELAEQMLHIVYFSVRHNECVDILSGICELMIHELNSVHECSSLACCKEISRQARATAAVLTLKVINFKLKIERYGMYM